MAQTPEIQPWYPYEPGTEFDIRHTPEGRHYAERSRQEVAEELARLGVAATVPPGDSPGMSAVRKLLNKRNKGEQ